VSETRIVDLRAYEVLDSRGNPTVEACVILTRGRQGSFSVPSGASTGTHEVLELRDGDGSRYRGLGTTRALANVLGPIREALIGFDASDQARLDRVLCELDGTPNKSRLGANALLAVSAAAAKAAASAHGLALYRYVGGVGATQLPVPLFNVLNGGAHADNGLDVQEYMIVPFGAPNEREAVRWGAEIYWSLRALLKEEGHRVSVGDEGGFAPVLGGNEQGLELVVRAIERAGYAPGSDVGVILDVAANEFLEAGAYCLRADGNSSRLSAADLVELYDRWLHRYPLLGIEDGLAEDDWEGWVALTQRLGDRAQLIGDDLFVTNVSRLAEGIRRSAGNAVIIKPNQVGTLTETIAAVRLAQLHGYVPVLANRSAETTDTFIAELAVALSVPQIKTGAPCRGERTAKYNELIRIEVDLGADAGFAGRSPFHRPD
jgi:enolase